MAKNDNGPSRERRSYWALKIFIITFFIAMLFSFGADLATRQGTLTLATILLVFLITINILFDGIAVAVTACDKAPLTSMASRKIKGSRIALKLQSNADIVSNICADVIGDICGIVSGACIIVIIMKIITINPSANEMVLTILLSSILASLIVGGKEVMKSFAINNSKELLMIVARVISVFTKGD